MDSRRLVVVEVVEVARSGRLLDGVCLVDFAALDPGLSAPGTSIEGI